MTHGSLFSGIGGFDLAAEWMGWENIFHCEWMPFPRQVLHYHFPKSISYEDITKTDFTIHRESIDILTGGFPCQPYSSAGKRLGKEDERHLWPHMLRAIQEIEPSYVVGENVRGLTNWNGGVVFEEVCADLEACGYEVQPILLPACAVGAPHRRDRVWFIATNTKNIRQEYALEDGELERRRFGKSYKRNIWDSFPSQSPICSGDDGIPNQLDGITFSKWRQESIKGYGKAIVPQVAYEIFKVINQMHYD
jgi:DNA (cytosine-5)-methyltransferase 1